MYANVYICIKETFKHTLIFKTMKTVTKTTTAITDSGKQLTMTVTAQRGWEKVKERLFNDGWESEVETMKKIYKTEIIIIVAGMTIKDDCLSTLVPTDLKAKGVVALCGKLGLTKRIYGELNPVVEATIAEAETDESWIRYQAVKAKARKEEEEYQAHVKKVENMMTLNGRTY